VGTSHAAAATRNASDDGPRKNGVPLPVRYRQRGSTTAGTPLASAAARNDPFNAAATRNANDVGPRKTGLQKVGQHAGIRNAEMGTRDDVDLPPWEPLTPQLPHEMPAMRGLERASKCW
jgi:hypothetical protein